MLRLNNQAKIFWGLIVALFIIMVIVTPDYGITGDEVTQWNYGKSVWSYLKTFGGDKTAVTGHYLENTQTYYGGFFDGVSCMLADFFHPKNEFLLRHYWNMLFAFFGILFTGLVAKEIAGWRAGILAVIFLVLTPRYFGEGFNNPKDIPFAAGYIIAIYCMLKWLKTIEKPNWKTTLFLGLGIGIGVSIRIGGLLLIAYLGLFYAIQMLLIKGMQKGYLKKSLLHLCVAVVVGYLLACLWWPYALEDVFTHPLEALKVMSSYPTSIRMLYNGEHIVSTFLPADYLPRMLFITTPIIFLLGLAGSIYLALKKARDKAYQPLWMILFVIIFPICYIIYKKSTLYDGVRHMIFILPPIIVAAAVFFDYLIKSFEQKPVYKWSVVALIAIGLFSPARFSLANHPNEYVYFNEFEGGVNGAYGYYETDYYMNSIKETTYKLAKLKGLYNTKDSVIIGTNCFEPMVHYAAQINPRLKLAYVRYRERSFSDWDYGIFYSRFVDKDLLQNGYFPPKHDVVAVKADTVTLSVAIERDPQKNDLKAYQALQAKNFPEAIAYYRKAMAYDAGDETLYSNFAIALASAGQMDEAISVMQQLLKMQPSDAQSYGLLAQLYQAKGDTQNARNASNTANGLMMEEAERTGQEN